MCKFLYLGLTYKFSRVQKANNGANLLSYLIFYIVTLNNIAAYIFSYKAAVILEGLVIP